MKKLFSAALALVIAASIAPSSFAGGVDNKTNLNAGYERNPSRNTECKRPEAVFYNIGGLSFMDDGLYAEVGDQLVFKKYTNKLDSPLMEPFGINGSYDDKRLVYLYPNAELVWKKGNTALFFGFGVFGGGGNLDYKNGTAMTALAFLDQANTYKSKAVEAQAAALKYKAAGDATNAAKYAAAAKQAGDAAQVLSTISRDHELSVYSVQLGEIVGISTQVTDWMSVAVAGRFMHGTQSISLDSPLLPMIGNDGDEIGYKADGFSIGGLFGFHFKPVDGLDLAVQYQSITRLNYRYHSYTGTDSVISGIITNKKSNFANDLPAVINLGAGYQVLEPLYVSTSFNYYFNKFATIENPVSGAEYDYKDSWEIALGADWQFTDSFLASTGISYGHNGTSKSENNIFSPVLDSFVIGAGVEYKFTKYVTGTGSLMYCKYFDEKFSDFDMTLSKNVTMLAFGVTVKPF